MIDRSRETSTHYWVVRIWLISTKTIRWTQNLNNIFPCNLRFHFFSVETNWIFMRVSICCWMKTESICVSSCSDSSKYISGMILKSCICHIVIIHPTSINISTVFILHVLSIYSTRSFRISWKIVQWLCCVRSFITIY